MTVLEERITVSRPPGECFRYVLDFSTIEQWDPGVYRATKRTPGPPKEGTVFDIVLSTMGRKMPMEYELVEVHSGERIVLRGQADGLRALDTIDFRLDRRGKCKLHYRADLQFDGLLSIAASLTRPWLEGVGRRAVEGLRRALTPERELEEPSIKERLKYRTVLPAAWEFTQRGYLKIDNKGLSDFVDGQTAVITGPTSGLGMASAKLLARLGARLILVGRDDERLAESCRAIQAFSGCSEKHLQVVEADLSKMAQVRRVVASVRSITDSVDILINNAGALFEGREETDEGHERTLAINLLCPFVLTTGLLGALSKAGGRVINVASGGMYTQGLRLDDMQFEAEPFDGAIAYARTKRALVALTDYWADHDELQAITFNSMHPGWADTPGVQRSLPRFYRLMKSQLRDARMGADTIAWLATSPAVSDESGLFFFDRRPRSKSILPGTSASPAQRQRLVQWLRTHSGSEATDTDRVSQ